MLLIKLLAASLIKVLGRQAWFLSTSAVWDQCGRFFGYFLVAQESNIEVASWKEDSRSYCVTRNSVRVIANRPGTITDDATLNKAL